MSEAHHLSVEAAYDRWSSFYDTYENPLVYAATSALADTSKVQGLRCLEFGCGTGRNLGTLATQGALSVTGLDLSLGMLEIAKIRASSSPAAHWDLMRHDMMETPSLPVKSMDLILFSLTLEHIEDLVTPLRHAKTLLAPSGKIRVLELHPFMSLNGSAAHFTDGDATVTMPTFPHQFEAWISAFAGAGLQIESFKEWLTRDFSALAPAKLRRRPPEWPWLVDFTLKP
jgi:ubiquinone/menaquinone biosynthesis C-methylase UbiE